MHYDQLLALAVVSLSVRQFVMLCTVAK